MKNRSKVDSRGHRPSCPLPSGPPKRRKGVARAPALCTFRPVSSPSPPPPPAGSQLECGWKVWTEFVHTPPRPLFGAWNLLQANGWLISHVNLFLGCPAAFLQEGRLVFADVEALWPLSILGSRSRGRDEGTLLRHFLLWSTVSVGRVPCWTLDKTWLLC